MSGKNKWEKTIRVKPLKYLIVQKIEHKKKYMDLIH